MLSSYAIEYYSKIRDELLGIEEKIEFIKVNNPIEEKQNILVEFLGSSPASNGSNMNYSIRKKNANDSEILIHKYMTKFREFKNLFDFVEFQRLVTTLELRIKEIYIKYNYEDESISTLTNHLNELSLLYRDVIMSGDSKQKIVVFFDKIQEYVAEYELSLSNINGYINSMSSNAELIDAEGIRIMELQLLDTEYSVGEFGEVLKNLDDVYSNIQRLIPNVKLSALKIVKIESGSLLSRILGDENVLEVIAIALRRIADYVHYTFTNQGKLELNAKIMQDISTDADIIKKLEDLGIDTKEAKQNISETLSAATKDLYNIVSTASKLKLDDEELIIAEPAKFIEYKIKYLEDKNVEEEKVSNEN